MRTGNCFGAIKMSLALVCSINAVLRLDWGPEKEDHEGTYQVGVWDSRMRGEAWAEMTEE